MASFPELVKDHPAKATKIIVRLMNIKLDNNWMLFAREVWPEYSELDIRSRFEEGRMKRILEKWGKEGATTLQLLQILIQIERNDVVLSLEEKFPSIRYFVRKFAFETYRKYLN